MQPTENPLTFPIKLKRILDAPETDHLIYWDEDGTSFHISDENQFAREVIPNYFKHSNISSFIRQLNMYGFHKINRVDGGLNMLGPEDSQWKHPFFQRDRPELLNSINRKVTTTVSNQLGLNFPFPKKTSDTPSNAATYRDIVQLTKAVQYLKQRDDETQEKMKAIQEENNQLYSEMMYLREEHAKQSKLIDLLVNFFSVYTSQSTINPILKPKRNLLALDLPDNGEPKEPPPKYFVTSPEEPSTSDGGQQSNSRSGTSANLLNTAEPPANKAKKIIRITNFKDNQLEFKVPQNNGTPNIYHIPSNPTVAGGTSSSGSNPSKILYTISLPKTPVPVQTGVKRATPSISRVSISSTGSPLGSRAITASSSQHSSLTPSARNAVAKPCNIFKSIQLSVPQKQQQTTQPPVSVASSDDTKCDMDLDALLGLHDSTNQNTTNSGEVANDLRDIFSDISCNVSTVGQGLNNLKRMLTLDNGLSSQGSASQSAILSDQAPSTTSTGVNSYWAAASETAHQQLPQLDNLIGTPDELSDQNLLQLWEAINSEQLSDDFGFINHSPLLGQAGHGMDGDLFTSMPNENTEQSQDSLIDNLLQTPDPYHPLHKPPFSSN